MKAILVDNEKRLHWSDVPDPVMGEDEVLVKIEAAGINRADLMQRDGDYPPPAGCPEWMGLEISGTVAEISAGAAEKSNLKIGNRVCALLGGGGYAEYVTVKYDMLMPIPNGCTMIEAAAIPEAFATSYLNLFIEGKAKAGDTVLVTGGNSGLASVMIPMAKAFGMRVITTVRGEKKAAAIAHLGADIVVDTLSQSLTEVLKTQLELGTPIDIAIDCVGGEDVGEYLRYLRHGARWIMIAALSGIETKIDLKNIYVRNVRLIGSTLRSRTPEVKAQILAELVEKVFPMVSDGKIRPTICKVFPIEEAEAGQAMLSSSSSVGKVVLTLK